MSAAPSIRPQVEVVPRLDADEVAAVALLVEAATETDGVRPLSEHVSLHLRHGGDDGDRSLLLYDTAASPPRLAGYAHLDPTDAVDGASAELVIHPDYRRAGLGRMLVEAVLAETPDGRLRLWAHGTHPAADALARAFGGGRERVLLQMRRSLWSPLPEPVLPDGVTLRTFRPGVDEEEWLALNAAAFAGHPDQGRWTRQDLDQRMAEPWFDPRGFLLAERDGRLIGFHWTKVHGRVGTHRHGEDAPHDHGHEALGEVYVVGVAPDARGGGLGAALVLAGLQHLRAAGLPTALLYVDADNTPAIRLYTGLGFTHWDTDAEYRLT